MQVLTRETVELARDIRRQLRKLGYEVPALSDPELVERLEALVADAADAALTAQTARLSALVQPTAAPQDPPAAATDHRSRGTPQAPSETPPPVDGGDDAGTPRPRRYYRGVPIDD